MTANSNKAKYGANLCIETEDDSPEIITKITGIDYSEIIVKGAQRFKPGSNEPIRNQFYKRNVWIYKTRKFEESTEWDLEKSIADLLTSLNQNKEKFRDIFSIYKESYILTYLYIEDYHISFNLSANTIQELNYYGLKLVFDFYSLGEEKK